MPDFTLNGRPLHAPDGTTLLAALHNAGVWTLKRAPGGAARGALCGMGVCFECRALVNGRWERTCLTPVQDGLNVQTLHAEGEA